MSSLVSTLVGSPIMTLFVVIGLGYLLGTLSIFGFRFGVAGVLFVGIAIGALDKAIALPEIIPSLGLIIFVYTIGIQSGPAFFASFKKQGLRDNGVALGLLIFGALLTLGLGHAMHLSAPRIAGLYSGALTNTPAVAAARERLLFQSQSENLTPDQVRDLSDQPIVAYGLAYPMGVIGVLLCFQLMRRVWKVDASEAQETPAIRAQDFVVKNPGVVGRTIGDLLQLHKDSGFVVSRIRKDGETQLVSSDTHLSEGDIVVVVGDESGIERARHLFGEPSPEQIELDRSELDFRRVFVSAPEVVGKRIGDLNLDTTLQATITRVRRGDVDVVPSAETILEFGDHIRVLTRRANFASVSQFFGDSIRGTAETDFGSVAIGMVLGALLGMVPMPLPGGSVVRLGLAGGPLLVALVLGKIERTGRITWRIPVSANLTLRQVGLLLFLAGVGTRAGFSFWQTLQSNGWQIVVAGTVVTFAVALATLFVGHKLLKMPYDSVMGMASGIHTAPASLAYAVNVSRNERPSVAYTTVYPMAMIAKIILAQLLV
ncbi:MAG TPA: aspartate:alanine exchanger family transporter [Clostridia bacterium]|nr:aspartate:alanine exchanger family transporter [Clostridia bacterium]